METFLIVLLNTAGTNPVFHISLPSSGFSYLLWKINWRIQRVVWIFYSLDGAHGGAVGRGTGLHVGRSRVRFSIVSLEFFIDIIITAPLWPWSTQPLTDMSTGIFPRGVKTAGAYGWQSYHLYVPIVLISGSLDLLEPSGPVQARNGIALPFYSLGTHLPTHSHSKTQNCYIPWKYVVLIFRLF